MPPLTKLVEVLLGISPLLREYSSETLCFSIRHSMTAKKRPSNFRWNCREVQASTDHQASIRAMIPRTDEMSLNHVIGTRKTHTVMSTCHFSGVRQLYKHSFDVVIIDEATQAMEAVSPSLCRRRRALRSGLGLLDTDIQSQETHPCGRPDAITPNH